MVFGERAHTSIKRHTLTGMPFRIMQPFDTYQTSPFILETACNECNYLI
jgi:hypothetical protein